MTLMTLITLGLSGTTLETLSGTTLGLICDQITLGPLLDHSRIILRLLWDHSRITLG